MKFKKIPGIPYFSRYEREDGKYLIETQTRNGKAAYVVSDREGNEIEVFAKMKDAKEKYSNE